MYLDKFKLTGKIAVVTGAARGIGLSTVEALAEAGATVVLTDMNPEVLAAATESMKAEGHSVDSEVLDVTDVKAVQAVHDAILARHGRVDVLVNNAGLGMRLVSERFNTEPTRFWEAPPQAWRRIVEANLIGAFNMARAAVPVMVAQGFGKVVHGGLGGVVVRLFLRPVDDEA